MATAPSPPKPPGRPRKTRRAGAQHGIVPFALLSLGCFLAGLLLLWLLVGKAELLVRLGLEGRLFYLVLLPLALAVAGFLFGVLRSYAHYKGKVLGGALELGGPVVVFCLVVLGGFLLVPPQAPFDLTVFVHGEGGVQDLPLRNQGFVVLDLGPDRRREPVGDRGQAHFSGIPATFRGQAVPVWLDAEGFTTPDPDPKRIEAGGLYLPVRREPVVVRGRVQDEAGQPIAGATLRLGELTSTSRTDGSFMIEIPGSLTGEDLGLAATAAGYAAWHEQVEPRSNDIVVVLRTPTS